MKKLICILIIFGGVIAGNNVNAQYLPPSYEPLFDEIVENFKEIRGGNSISDGKTSLRLLSDTKIILRMDHKKSVKTLTFVVKKDEEGNEYWMSFNKLTTDMINKYESDLTKILNKMLEISRDEAKI